MVDSTLVGVASTMAVGVFKLEEALAMNDLALRRGDSLDKVVVEEGQASLEATGMKVIAMSPLVRIMRKVNPVGLSAWVTLQILEMIGGQRGLQFQFLQQF
jgi:hypothetical protein